MKTLKFNTLDELTTFICENNIDIQELEINFPENEKAVEQEIIEQINNLEVKLLSLNNNPVMLAEAYDENIICVEDIDFIENSCSTAKIRLNEKIIWLNVCNNDGISKVNLDIAINEKFFYNVPFVVKKKDSDDSFSIKIKKDMLQ